MRLAAYAVTAIYSLLIWDYVFTYNFNSVRAFTIIIAGLMPEERDGGDFSAGKFKI